MDGKVWAPGYAHGVNCLGFLEHHVQFETTYPAGLLSALKLRGKHM